MKKRSAPKRWMQLFCLALAVLAGIMPNRAAVSCAADLATAFPVGWRGDGSGRFPANNPPANNPPTKWGGTESKNIAWKADIGESYSSPLVVGSRIFVTAEPHWLVCLHRADGKVLWRKSNSLGELPNPQLLKLPKTSCGYTTPTPTCDGKYVYVVLGSGVVASYDLAGNRRWIKLVDEESGDKYGQSASPLIIGSKLILHLKSLIALDTATGEEVWRNKDAWPGYGSPIAARAESVDVVVTAKGDVFQASDGKTLMTGMAATDYSTPIIHDKTIYFIDAAASALRFPTVLKRGAEPEELWFELLAGEFYASPVYYNGLIYAVNRTAHIWALDAKTGKVVWDAVLPLPVARQLPPEGETRDESKIMPSVFPSITLIGDLLYISNDAGQTVVVASGRQYRKIAENSLPNGSPAAVVAAGNQLFIRSGKSVLCIQEP